MGIFNELGRKIKEFDYEGTAEKIENHMERQAAQVEERFRKEIKMKVRNSSTELLKLNKERYEEKGNYIAVDEIEKELMRRGEY